MCKAAHYLPQHDSMDSDLKQVHSSAQNKNRTAADIATLQMVRLACSEKSPHDWYRIKTLQRVMRLFGGI
jgi:hypothetical protein